MTHHEHHGRSSEEIRRDIERRRAHMDGTVDELEARLSPGQLLGEVLRLVRGGGSDGASRVASGAKSFARDYPIPSALLSAGAVWLAAERARGEERDVGAGTYARAEGRVGPYRGDEVPHDDSHWAHNRGAGDRVKESAGGAAHAVGDRASSAKDSAMHAASSAKESVREKASSAKDSVRETASSAKESVRETASEARRKGAEGARRARGGFMHALEDNPMAVGAALFGIGVAGGMTAPTTGWEDEHMGERADELKDRAKHVAKDTGQSARRVASDTARAVRDEVQRQGVTEQIRETAKRVASDAKETAKHTAKERAREEGLSREGLKAAAKGEAKPATGTRGTAGTTDTAGPTGTSGTPGLA